jgi:hypothetical protein
MSIDYEVLQRQIKSVDEAIVKLRQKITITSNNNRLIGDLEGVKTMLTYIFEEGEGSNLNAVGEDNPRESADVINDRQ